MLLAWAIGIYLLIGGALLLWYCWDCDHGKTPQPPGVHDSWWGFLLVYLSVVLGWLFIFGYWAIWDGTNRDGRTPRRWRVLTLCACFAWLALFIRGSYETFGPAPPRVEVLRNGRVIVNVPAVPAFGPGETP